MPPLVAVSSEHTWRVSGAPEFDWGFSIPTKRGDAASTRSGFRAVD
jgi:hypothetical protein